MALDMTYYQEMEAKIPHGKVRTRFSNAGEGLLIWPLTTLLCS